MLAYFYGYILIGATFCFIPLIHKDLMAAREVTRKVGVTKPLGTLIMLVMVLTVVFLWPLEIPSILRGKK